MLWPTDFVAFVVGHSSGQPISGDHRVLKIIEIWRTRSITRRFKREREEGDREGNGGEESVH